MVGFNCDRDRLFVDCTCEVFGVSGRDVSASGVLEDFHLRSIAAFSISGSVAVLAFKSNTVIDDISESRTHITTIAALVFIRAASAVYKLLRREDVLLASRDGG